MKYINKTLILCILWTLSRTWQVIQEIFIVISDSNNVIIQILFYYVSINDNGKTGLWHIVELYLQWLLLLLSSQPWF